MRPVANWSWTTRRAARSSQFYGPGFVRPCRRASVLSQLGLYPPLGRLVAQLQAQGVVYPVGLLDVDPPALALQQHMHPAIAVAHARLADRLYAGFEAGLVGATGSVVIARRVHLQHPASPPDRHAPITPTPVHQLALATWPQSFGCADLRFGGSHPAASPGPATGPPPASSAARSRPRVASAASSPSAASRRTSSSN